VSRLPVAPNRDLGQHFLVDENILGVIGRFAELAPADVVLEIGPGLGVLTRYLADRVVHVHAVEVDRGLEPYLRERLDRRTNVEIVFGDALRVDLAALAPTPTKLVANLPYNVATPLVVESLSGLPSIALWCVMVQREIAERLASPPGVKTYGVPSVIVQLACAVKLVRPISRHVFHPVPNVDSALVRLRRIGPGPSPPVRTLVQAAFAHRRKALPRSLELALRKNRDVREAARSALAEIGHPKDERAERLAPEEFVALAQRLEQWL
jgi:16S rRNA (adenine1518-N6/adenine1519-N6)-dimethyltransferase